MSFFEGDFEKKVSALDPKFREKISELFETMQRSISMLYESAIRDEKTGLYNHKFFETIIKMEIEKVKRNKEKLSLIIIDIDFFKKLNDTYGHLKGDELLAHLAKLLLKTLRKSDIVSRFGGEEFFLLLPETSLEKAKRLGARLKRAVHADKILKKYDLTISGGITEFRKRDTETKFKERADKALYQAKKQGRDRFVVSK